MKKVASTTSSTLGHFDKKAYILREKNLHFIWGKLVYLLCIKNYEDIHSGPKLRCTVPELDKSMKMDKSMSNNILQ